MRNQQVGRASRVALFAVLLVSLSMWACQDPQQQVAKDATSDFALGVDGEFGVETFALGVPSLSFLLPTSAAVFYLEPGGINQIPGTPCQGSPGAYFCTNTGFYCDNGGKADPTLCSPFVQLSVSNFQLGAQGFIDCRVSGGATTFSSDPAALPDYSVTGHTDMVQIASIGYTQGLYTLECVLVDLNHAPLFNAEARAKRPVQLISDPLDPAGIKCKNDAQCDDSNACSAEICIAGKCQYTAMANCCTDDWFCAPGETCLNPNSLNSKCSTCQIDADCDDAVSCTVDKCDMTGTKGACTHTVPPETCCAGFTKCDDGKPCTVDSCDLDNSACVHVQNPGACCFDSECVPSDPCKVGGCVALTCRYAVNGDKKDCCSDTTNTSCDDKNICTNDSCGNAQPGGWTQCKHESNGVPGCCMVNEDCNDNNGCTQDLCLANQCAHKDLQDCCKTAADCNDANICTDDSCPIVAGLDAAQCIHAKKAECCNTIIDCNDQKFCTADACDTVAHTCTHTQSNMACCDQDSQCSDGKICTADLCINHACIYPKDGNKPDCCEDNNAGTCDDKNSCTIDSCKIQTGCGAAASQAADVVITGLPSTYFPSGTNYYAQPFVSASLTGGSLVQLDIPVVNTNLNPSAKLEVSIWSGDPIAGNTVQLGAVALATLPTPTAGQQLVSVTGFGSVAIAPNVQYFVLVHALDPAIQFLERANAYNGAPPASYSPTAATGPFTPYLDGTGSTGDLYLKTFLGWPAQPPCDANNNVCQHTPNGVVGCCNSPADCNDNDCHTLDVCGSNNMCIYKPNPYACSSDLDCDDANGCTIDACDSSTGCGQCTHSPAPGCCTTDIQCDDKVVCTNDTCVNFQCAHSAKANCCTTDADALTICDDKNSCTIDYCEANQCHHSAPKDGCCKSNADCFDGNKCTADICDTKQVSGDHYLCTYTVPDPNCQACTAESAIAGIDCNDNNLCTQDYCDGAGNCHNNPIAECCMDKTDCDDHNDCTADYCTGQHSCFHGDTTSGILICCKPASQDVDCAYLNTECQKGICVDAGNGNGSTKCVAQNQDVCTVNIGYCQSFEAPTTLHGMGWNPMIGDMTTFANPTQNPANWSVQNTGSLGPDGYANFSWTPTKTTYGTCLQSPIIQAAGANTITLQYDHAFEWNSNSTQITILGSLDGANADWSTATVIESTTASKNFGPETLDVKLPTGPSGLTGSNGLRLAFCLQGASTFDVLNFSLDNVCIVKGGKPSMVTCPVNQVVPFQTKKTIPLKAKDPDAGDLLFFQIVEGPAFVSLSSAMYFWLDKSWNSTLTINPTDLADIGTHTIKIKVSDGALYSICTFNITVSYNGGYLIVRPTTVPSNLGDALVAGLNAAAPGKVVQHIDDMSLYASFSQFEAVFLVLGVYPDNHVLTEGESTKFQTYLNGGGRLYMEGGDTWQYDPPTSLHASFKVNGLADSVPEGISAQLLGYSIYKDLSTIVNGGPKVYNFGFSQSNAFNDSNDSISAKEEVHRTQNMLKSNGTFDQPWVQVGHDDDAGFRTVASSTPFAGVMTGVTGDAPSAMIGRILSFFDNGFIDCLVDGDCNDQDDCTIDTCTKGECFFQNKCTCLSNQLLGCGDQITVVTGGTGSTAAVKSYGCDPTKLFLGKEMGYTFSTTSSRPATLTVTGTPTADARVFVTRTVADVCAPTECIAETGVGTKNFAAAANEIYYIMVDTPTLQATQLTLQVTCGDPEICNDGIDNNNNGLVDCQDLASCCGDAACGEICDGVDNNCDGQFDEGCDKDGDGWCDKTMTVVGLPPICPNGSGDCNDAAGTIHPGQADLCGNYKDDNCNGQTDEGGTFGDGSGCTNYWADQDIDGFGGGSPSCLCLPTTTLSVTKGGDCDDNNKKVNPNMIEICGNGVDDNCNGSQNDQNAQGCTDFYRDLDGDGAGANPIGNSGLQCLCIAAGDYTAPAPGDCNDANFFVYPGAIEVCNNIDDNCDGVIDEGCDDDKDGYCDATMGYVSIGVTSQQCGQGQEGAMLSVACEVGRTITSVDFASFGNPTGVCGTYKAGTCVGASALQAVKAACLKKSTCSITIGSSLLGDGCPGQAKVLDIQVTCMGSGGTPPGVCPNGPGDTNDNDPSINPAGQEICDNIDNNSDGQVDEGCDDDLDGYCDANMITLGAPLVCPGGGNDCDDTNPAVHPGATEDCLTPYDDNCDIPTNINDENADNCTVFFKDVDNDGYGTKDFKCYCTPVGLFKAKKTADCDDTTAAINPGVIEICNGIDDDCDGVIDNGCDVDGDGYCAIGKEIVTGNTVCINGGGDCDDNNFDVNPGKAEVCGDGIDNNCNGSQNDAGALLCTVFYADVDQDGYGTPSAKCLCAAAGNFTAGASGDCNDGKDVVTGLTCATGDAACLAAAAAINPAAQEICDNIDNNCNTVVDESCDKDGDGYCDSSKQIIGTPTACPNGGGDCNDYPDACTTNPSNAPNCGGSAIHPNLLKEVCDNIDDDCDGVVDNGCDKDSDGYCDKDWAIVGSPLVCSAGTGDCDDYDNTVHPNAPEICGNGKDDNCNGNLNDEGAVNCKNFYQDADADGFGLIAAKCLCVPEGGYTGKTGGDCDDSNPLVHPGQPENCATPYDDNCNLDTNDQDALGCTTFALDGDGDGYGLPGLSKCFCEGSAPYVALMTAAADCNDANKDVNPGETEKCNDIDDNCVNGVDEGCNKDGDKFCDSAMVTVGFPNVCAAGGGDCVDTNANINPGQPELCDGLDNNCSLGINGTDEGCDDDGDFYCDANMVTVKSGNNFPNVCTLGGKVWNGTAWVGGDCDDTNKFINPGMQEQCNTVNIDDNCNGDSNDIGANGCNQFGVDIDGDTYSDKNKPTTCYCHAVGTSTGTNAGDCNDLNNLVHPLAQEICDGVDNDCNGVIDDGCDKDHDGYCDSTKTTIGAPKDTCPNGGGDCDDNNYNINPGVKEDCLTGWDDNCINGTNDAGALNCITFNLDFDGDLYGVGVSQCTCIATAPYTINVATGGHLGDCDDNNANVNPGKTEICGDGIDNNCDGSQNDINATGSVLFYVDVDKDGYGPATGGSQKQCFAQGSYVSSLSGDCNDGGSCTSGDTACLAAAASQNPGMTEICDNLDNNCQTGFVNGVSGTTTAIDEGCNKDGDTYCDATILTIGKPPVCTDGGGDCNDTVATGFGINPKQSEICDNVDQNCNKIIDEGCDKDKDGFCDSQMTVTSAATQVGAICKWTTITGGKGDDCNDLVSSVFPQSPILNAPTAVEICDGLDNNCNGQIDEGCDKDQDGYCDSNMQTVNSLVVNIVGSVCTHGGGDCNDGVSAVTGVACAVGDSACWAKAKTINPGALEVCDNIDNNCAGGTDETCKDNDGDGYCSGPTFIGSSPKCSAGGGDCNDNAADIHPGVQENCATPYDDNCDGVTNPNDGGSGSVYAFNTTKFWPDADGDGYGALGSTGYISCYQWGSYTSLLNNDCDDTKKAVNPGAQEICDNVDNDCKNGKDDGCDNDLDGFCDSTMLITSTALCDVTSTATHPAVGATQAGSDCNDTNFNINVSIIEVCNNLDDSCSGVIDKGCDDDKDGYCDVTMAVSLANGAVALCPSDPACAAGSGKDCNDTNFYVNPGPVGNPTKENCATAYDDNCNGQINEAGAMGCWNFLTDADHDGWGSATVTCLCGDPTAPPAGYAKPANGGDCNDSKNVTTGATCAPSDAACLAGAATQYPGNAEICDGVDNNCDAFNNIDEGCDDDKDGYCDVNILTVSGAHTIVNPKTGKATCFSTPFTYTTVGGNTYGDDCVDSDAAIHPNAPEICDGVDNNCVAGYVNGTDNGRGTAQIDEGCDKDGDTHCDVNKVTVGTPAVCTRGGGDCNDGKDAAGVACAANVAPGTGCWLFAAGIHPILTSGALAETYPYETCNGQDDDCNGLTDDNPTAASGKVFYKDADADGEPSLTSTVACAALGQYTWDWTAHGKPAMTTSNTDCRDDPTVCGANCNHNLLENSCDGFDNNCNGNGTSFVNGTTVDEGCDDDADGYCDAAMFATAAGIGPGHFCPNTLAVSANNTGDDCDDRGGALYPTLPGKPIHPGATELCNNIDDNCNGSTDGQPNLNSIPPIASGSAIANTETANLTTTCSAPHANAVWTCNSPATVSAACGFSNCTGTFVRITPIASNLECTCDTNSIDAEPNNDPAHAVVLNTVSDGTAAGGTGLEYFATGLVATSADHDWFKFWASDSNSGADHYAVRVYFTTVIGNSSDGVVFDVYRGPNDGTVPTSAAFAPVVAFSAGTAGAPAFRAPTWTITGVPARSSVRGVDGTSGNAAGWNQVCCGDVDMNWFTNFRDQRTGHYNTNMYQEYGELNCTASSTFDQVSVGWNGRSVGSVAGWWQGTPYPERIWPMGTNWGPSSFADVLGAHPQAVTGFDMTQCVDDGAMYYVHVYRNGVSVSCQSYQFSYSNNKFAGTKTASVVTGQDTSHFTGATTSVGTYTIGKNW